MEYIAVSAFIVLALGFALVQVWFEGRASKEEEVLTNNAKVDKQHKELANAQIKKALNGATSRADAVKRMQRQSNTK